MGADFFDKQVSDISQAEKIEYFSRKFLGSPYCLGALGEGKQSLFDQNPLYRFDCFDCLTYVNTVLALAVSSNWAEFTQTMIRLNYYDIDPQYVNRFHFMSVDWNIENEKSGFIADVTTTIKDSEGKSFALCAEAVIDRPAWFKKRSLQDLKLIDPITQENALRLLAQLHLAAEDKKPEQAKVMYLPIEKLFNQEGEVITSIFEQIPHASIVEIVRPNWDLRETIGTHLLVSHLGFVFQTEKGVMFRHATSIEKRVVEVPLSMYLQNCLRIPTIKGINIQVIL